jgi:hypothetical protein
MEIPIKFGDNWPSGFRDQDVKAYRQPRTPSDDSLGAKDWALYFFVACTYYGS